MADVKEDIDENHDPHFDPIVSLPEQEVRTLEEDESELFKMRAKLFRYASESEPGEWKERGTGDVKLLQHKQRRTVRLLMRRDKTLKICANHYITPLMELKPNVGSDRAWVWSTLADFTDNEARPEMLALRFLNAENAQKFKQKFEECQRTLKEENDGHSDVALQVMEKLHQLQVAEEGDEEEDEEEGDDDDEEEEEEGEGAEAKSPKSPSSPSSQSSPATAATAATAATPATPATGATVATGATEQGREPPAPPVATETASGEEAGP
ncbi:ran-specific GTPase-activating protein [Petromyzon marinus]|uniref:ran-specific GTPase-activating protein n=1 Tax=Petromyzon marinus TaxID=7757 RepID=UPI003F6F2793